MSEIDDTDCGAAFDDGIDGAVGRQGDDAHRFTQGGAGQRARGTGDDKAVTSDRQRHLLAATHELRTHEIGIAHDAAGGDPA